MRNVYQRMGSDFRNCGNFSRPSQQRDAMIYVKSCLACAMYATAQKTHPLRPVFTLDPWNYWPWTLLAPFRRQPGVTNTSSMSWTTSLGSPGLGLLLTAEQKLRQPSWRNG